MAEALGGHPSTGKPGFSTFPHGKLGLAEQESGLSLSPLPLQCRHEARRGQGSFTMPKLNTAS